jgi:hypothetical protein
MAPTIRLPGWPANVSRGTRGQACRVRIKGRSGSSWLGSTQLLASPAWLSPPGGRLRGHSRRWNRPWLLYRGTKARPGAEDPNRVRPKATISARPERALDRRVPCGTNATRRGRRRGHHAFHVELERLRCPGQASSPGSSRGGSGRCWGIAARPILPWSIAAGRSRSTPGAGTNRSLEV